MNRSLLSLAATGRLVRCRNGRRPDGADRLQLGARPRTPSSVAQKEWCDLVEKNSAGRVKCNILPRAVANPPGTYDAVKNGLADVSFTVHGYTPGRFVLTQMAEFPSWAIRPSRCRSPSTAWR
jgi:TRAP-type C4-dicarboxylate transport system substrate-binding protein